MDGKVISDDGKNGFAIHHPAHGENLDVDIAMDIVHTTATTGSTMTREELDRLRSLRAEIESDIRQLRGLEKKERTAAQHGQSLLRTLKRRSDLQALGREKEEETHAIIAKQKEYLALRAAMEERISQIPDHYLRVVLSLLYVDGLTTDEAAAIIQGPCTGGGIIQLLVRYFNGDKKHDSFGIK